MSGPDASRNAARSRRSFLTTLAAGATVAALAGCTDLSGQDYSRSQADFDPPDLSPAETYPAGVDVSTFRRGLRRLGYYPDATVPDAVGVDWARPVNYIGHTAAKSSPRPTPDGETVVVAADTGRIHGLRPDGRERYTYRTDATSLGIHGTPTIVDGVAYVGGYDGALYAIDAATGEEVWTTGRGALDGAIAIGSSPAYWDGTLYFQAEYSDPDTGALWAVDAATGDTLFVDRRPDGMPHPTPAISPQSERLVVGSNDGVVYAWEFPSLEFAWSYETDGEVKGTPPVYDGKTVVGSWDGTIYCLGLAEGEELWTVDTGDVVMSNPGVDPERNLVFVGSDDHLVRAIDLDDGTVRWTHDVGGHVIGSLTVADDAVLVGSYDTRLYALEAGSGDVRWTVTNRGHVTSEAVPHDGNIYYAERAHIDHYWSDEQEAQFQQPGHVYRLSGRE